MFFSYKLKSNKRNYKNKNSTEGTASVSWCPRCSDSEFYIFNFYPSVRVFNLTWTFFNHWNRKTLERLNSYIHKIKLEFYCWEHKFKKMVFKVKYFSAINPVVFTLNLSIQWWFKFHILVLTRWYNSNHYSTDLLSFRLLWCVFNLKRLKIVSWLRSNIQALMLII